MPSLHPEVRSLLQALLDVLDNLERAIGAAQDEQGAVSVGEGVRGIHRQLSDLVYQYGVRPFTAEGAPFDPARHEAMGRVPSDAPVNHVAQELRRGYLLGERLFRSARVLVSAGTGSQPVAAAAVGAPGRAGQPRPQRSAASRPPWLLNPPQGGSATLYAVGRAAAAADLDEGLERAREAALGVLAGALVSLAPEGPRRTTAEALAAAFGPPAPRGLWQRLAADEPDAESWVDDYYWERVQGEIRGSAYDVAVLLAVGRDGASDLLLGSGEIERWGGLELVDAGPLLAAVNGGGRGALVIETHLGGQASRSGFRPGDLITRVAQRKVDEAAATRRLMTLSAKGRRPFDVEIVRDGAEQTLRVGPR